MVKLILVRHGQTDWNAEGRFQGQSDIPLNDLGRRQARRLASRLRTEKLDLIVASDLRRAWRTAELIAEPHGIDVQAAPGLREMNFGEWEGLTYDEISQRYAGRLDAWQKDPLNVGPPGGESLAKLEARVRDTFDNLVHICQNNTTLVVAHGGSLQALLCSAYGLDPRRYWQFRLDPASLSELYVYPEGPILTLLNDCRHLTDNGEETNGKVGTRAGRRA